MMQVSLSGRSMHGVHQAPTTRPKVALAALYPRRPIIRAVAVEPPAPLPGHPPRRWLFDTVTRQLAAVRRREGDTPRGDWAARVGAALSQYARAEARLQQTPPTDPNYRSVYLAARRALDVVLLMKERCPPDLARDLDGRGSADATGVDGGVGINLWESACQTSRAVLARQPIPRCVVPATPESRGTALQHLQRLLESLQGQRLAMPAVSRWLLDVADALAHYQAAEQALLEQGPGPQGLLLAEAAAACQALLDEEARVPYDVAHVTRRENEFESVQRWLDRIGPYKLNQSGAVRDLLQMRLSELQNAAAE